MFTVSYTVSEVLKNRLAKIDSLQQKILTTPVSPQTEVFVRWQAMQAHLEGWARLSNQPITKTYVVETLNRLQTKNASALAGKIISYKKGVNYVRESWSANQSRVAFAGIRELAGILEVSPGTQKEVEAMLAYLQSGQMHPVIQSAIAHLYFYPSRLSYLTSLLFLARYGYDLRGWLSLEDYWYENKQEYLEVTQKAASSAATTLWLEYFCQAVITQMEKISTKLASLLSSPLPMPKRLTSRQKGILDKLDKPGSSITNREVQLMFKVPQVTASRDLARLAQLNLLAAHGRGRSTHYTRI